MNEKTINIFTAALESKQFNLGEKNFHELVEIAIFSPSFFPVYIPVRRELLKRFSEQLKENQEALRLIIQHTDEPLRGELSELLVK